ncbi:hypothetical protein [uncultured Tenacibaculum sp.]|uniref:hypothetical protein n=1 Tax=uncultured Tenacibaculum sp. TaxID=174713 RepID=UPI0026143481|nr:hypothetical protein [uncultured Tenacibaculum sp.]
MKTKNSKKDIYFILMICIGLASFGYYLGSEEKRQLEKSHLHTIGTIIKKYRIPKRGYRIRYRYSINGSSYEENQDLTIKVDLVKLGDKFKVKYSDEDHSVSELIFEKRINN